MIDVERLYVDAVDSQSVDYDWTEHENVEYGETNNGIGWQSWEHVSPDEGETATCNECGESIIYRPETADEPARWYHNLDDAEAVTDADDEHDAEPDDDYRSDEREGPMMNYYYPCPIDDPEAAAKLIADLPLCIVQIDGDTTAFALTGGGMDLSWEICEAFIRCGHLPPFKYASELPRMAMTLDDDKRTVLAAARRTCNVVAGRAQSALGRLDGVEEYYSAKH